MVEDGGKRAPESPGDGSNPSLSAEDRVAALQAGRSPVPLKFIGWAVAVFIVLGLGGELGEHFWGAVGSTPTTTVGPTPTPTEPSGAQLQSSLAAFMGLKQIESAEASPFNLTDQAGNPWSLAGARGRVVVLTFYNVNCNDICPVLGAELREARALLGPHAHQVEFVIVNTDPRHDTLNRSPPALTRPGLRGTPLVYFLTGSLRQLDDVWIKYGVSIRVGETPTELAHNDILYFIGPTGKLVEQATPYGNESLTGVYRLDASDIHRFAQGIATTAVSLIR